MPTTTVPVPESVARKIDAARAVCDAVELAEIRDSAARITAAYVNSLHFEEAMRWGAASSAAADALAEIASAESHRELRRSPEVTLELAGRDA